MKEKLTAVLHAQDSGTLAKARRETVGAFLERWVADVPVRETTRIHCRRNVQLHIVPALGRIPLAKLTGMGSPLRSSEAADTGTLTSVQNVPPAWSRQGPKVFFFHGPIALVTSIARQQHRDRMRSYLLEFMVTHPAATACALRQQLRKSLPWAHAARGRRRGGTQGARANRASRSRTRDRPGLRCGGRHRAQGGGAFGARRLSLATAAFFRNDDRVPALTRRDVDGVALEGRRQRITIAPEDLKGALGSMTPS